MSIYIWFVFSEQSTLVFLLCILCDPGYILQKVLWTFRKYFWKMSRRTKFTLIKFDIKFVKDISVFTDRNEWVKVITTHDSNFYWQNHVLDLELTNRLLKETSCLVSQLCNVHHVSIAVLWFAISPHFLMDI